MQRNQVYRVLSVALLLTGALFIASPEPSITGAVTGAADFPGINPLIGVILITLAGALVVASKEEKKSPGQLELEKIQGNIETYDKTIERHFGDILLYHSALEQEKRKYKKDDLEKFGTAEKIAKAGTNKLYELMKESRGIKSMDPKFKEQFLRDTAKIDTYSATTMGMETKFSTQSFIKYLSNENVQKQILQQYEAMKVEGINPELQKDVLKEIGAGKYMNLNNILNKPQTLEQTVSAVGAYDKGKGSAGPKVLKQLFDEAYLKPEYRKN